MTSIASSHCKSVLLASGHLLRFAHVFAPPSYKQALHGAQTARTLAQKHKFPFTRPADYFAEMVKSDAHMERIRQRLLDESAGMKRSEEKRKEREGKKFGKQVQLEKLKERQQNKKEIEERLKGLKRSECHAHFPTLHHRGSLAVPCGERIVILCTAEVVSAITFS